MPEGHTIHRVAAFFREHFAGHTVQALSPQGRFVEGARRLDGSLVHTAQAVGKQLFVSFSDDVVLRVHLGIYGAWSVYGDGGLGALGAPRITPAREEGFGLSRSDGFPPEPVGQVRLRLILPRVVADLRGPAACELLSTGDADQFIARLGPDPLVGAPSRARSRFVEAMEKTTIPIGQALMNQKLVGGIGNVYRAELLYRHHLDPFVPTKLVPRDTLEALWADWARLLRRGVKTGVMLTREDLSSAMASRALQDSSLRHYVYKRAGQACYRCSGTIQMRVVSTRKLYFCPGCQNLPSR